MDQHPQSGEGYKNISIYPLQDHTLSGLQSKGSGLLSWFFTWKILHLPQFLNQNCPALSQWVGDGKKADDPKRQWSKAFQRIFFQRMRICTQVWPNQDFFFLSDGKSPPKRLVGFTHKLTHTHTFWALHLNVCLLWLFLYVFQITISQRFTNVLFFLNKCSSWHIFKINLNTIQKYALYVTEH